MGSTGLGLGVAIPHDRIIGLDALPFVRIMQGQSVVISLCDTVLSDPAQQAQLVEDIALLFLLGVCPVVVHGMSGMAQCACDQARSSLVQQLNAAGVKALGLEGADANLATLAASSSALAKQINVEPELITLLQQNRMLPVLTALATDEKGGGHPFDPAVFAAQLAQQLKARALVLICEDGALRKAGIKAGVVDRRGLGNWLKAHASDAVATAIQAAIDAVDHGVMATHLLVAGRPGALIETLMSNAGESTVLCRHSAARVLADTARYFQHADNVIRENFAVAQKVVVRF